MLIDTQPVAIYATAYNFKQIINYFLTDTKSVSMVFGCKMTYIKKRLFYKII